MRKTRDEMRGITLIALVVTIVVLLILASVSITVVFGDNGILQLAKEAGEKTNEAVQKDKQDVQNLVADIDDIVNPPVDILEIKGKVTENTKAVDKYGNKIIIPAGFEIVPNGTDYVEYNYDTNEEGAPTHIPTVQDGIVIKDDENYFVWIPVGTIKNKPNDERGKTSDITLGRYTFDITKKWIDSSNCEIEGTGEAHLVQSALNYADICSETGAYQELESSKYGNAVAKSLSTFLTKANMQGGYYLARYEAVKGQDERVKSKPSNIDTAPWNVPSILAGMVWVNITQQDASIESQRMYEKNSNFETDLVNSYAWKTAVVFIQTYSKNTTYSKQTSLVKKYSLTGERSDEETTDKVCNIYDMSSNVSELTTETYTRDNDLSPCVIYGGDNYHNDYYVCNGNYLSAPYINSTIGFRTILYII